MEKKIQPGHAKLGGLTDPRSLFLICKLGLFSSQVKCDHEREKKTVLKRESHKNPFPCQQRHVDTVGSQTFPFAIQSMCFPLSSLSLSLCLASTTPQSFPLPSAASPSGLFPIPTDSTLGTKDCFPLHSSPVPCSHQPHSGSTPSPKATCPTARQPLLLYTQTRPHQS